MANERKTIPLAEDHRKRKYRNQTEQEWVKSSYYCPYCGKQDMWQEADADDDYYHSCSVTCHSCQYDMCCVEKIR